MNYYKVKTECDQTRVIKEIHKLDLEQVLLIVEMSKYKFWTEEYKSLIPVYDKLALEIQHKKAMLTNNQLEKYLTL